MSNWYLISNRLPFTYNEETGKISQSSGGLVTALNGIKGIKNLHWIGVIDEAFPREELKKLNKKSSIQFDGPRIDSETYDNYYNGFCNDVLWPLLHYETERVNFNDHYYSEYKKVNEIFAKFLNKKLKKGDFVWIHDFHFFLLPKYIKEKFKDQIKIGFFLHVPFPSSEIYRQLTSRREIITNLIHADLIGFHDFSYLRHFSRTVYDILGHSTKLMKIRAPHGSTKLGVFPVSIPTKQIQKKSESKKVEQEITNLQLKKKSTPKIILGVDRLDYTKGIKLKLESFKNFLTDNPKYVGKVQLLQVAVPSRTDVPEYIEIRHEIESLVGEINGQFGNINYQPVNYIFNSISNTKLLALYRSSEVLMVSSRRDGMNLVCLEYIVAQNKRNPGVILLSEFTGATSTLSHALSINPHNIVGTSYKIKQALEMPKEERKERHKVMFDYLNHYDSTNWARSFMTALNESEIERHSKCKNILHRNELNDVVKKTNSKKKVIFLDFDGTLAPIVDDPEKANISAKTKGLIKKISSSPDNTLVIISGRPHEFLQQKFKDINCYLAFEHGALFYDYKIKKVRNLVSTKPTKWFQAALKIIDDYTKRTPNSFHEVKSYSLTWHYRQSPADFGDFQAKNLVADLKSCFSHLPVSVISGKKVVEIKSREANKGRFSDWFMDRHAEEGYSVFAIGDDRTDEDLFESLGKDSISIKVGHDRKTFANFYVDEQSKVDTILEKLLI